MISARLVTFVKNEQIDALQRNVVVSLVKHIKQDLWCADHKLILSEKRLPLALAQQIILHSHTELCEQSRAITYALPLLLSKMPCGSEIKCHFPVAIVRLT